MIFCIVFSPAFSQETPSRIAALEIPVVDALTALQVTPACITVGEDVGGAFNQLGPGYLLKVDPHLKSVPQVGSRQHPNLEALLQCKPTLILGDKTRDHAIESQLKRIAPTFLLSSLRVSYSEMIQTFLTIAHLTQREDKAKQVLKEQEKIMAQAKKEMDPKAPPFLVVSLFPDGTLRTFTDNSYIAKFFSFLGRPYALPTAHGELEATLTLEGLLAINPPTLVILLTDGNLSGLNNIQKNPLWQRLKAVQSQHLYLADRAIWVQSPGILSSREILKEAAANGFLKNKPTPLEKQPIPKSAHWL